MAKLTAKELNKRADELAAKAKEARKVAKAAERAEKRAEAKRAAEELARTEIAALQHSKKMTVQDAKGNPVSVYDWVMADYRQSIEKS